MATLRDIRRRIRSVENIQQVTRAMKLVGATEGMLPRAGERLGEVLFRWRGHISVPFILLGCLLVFLGPHDLFEEGSLADELFDWGAVALALAGEALRVWSVGYAGRSTRGRRAKAPLLVTAGPYACVRNPIYLGNFLIALAFAVAAESPLLLLLVPLYFFGVYGPIVRHEEAFLRETFGADYEAYCAQVRRWRPRLRPLPGGRGTFQWGALRKEHWTVLTVVALLALPELAEGLREQLARGAWGELPMWTFNQWRVVGSVALAVLVVPWGVGPESVGLVVASLGVLLRLWALGHLEKKVRLAQSGPYGWVRNPLYLANLLIALGIAWAARVPWWMCGTILLALAWAYSVRVAREERSLRALWGDVFEEYCRRVPRWLPRWPGRGDAPGRFSWTRLRANRGVAQLAGYALFVFYWDLVDDVLYPHLVMGYDLAYLWGKYFRHVRGVAMAWGLL